MKIKTKVFYGILVLSLILSVAMLGLAGAAEMKHKGHADMEMHHFHELMNHGLEMVTEGSNLAMLAQMKMAPGVDEMTLDHGKKMIKEGKDLITRCLNGPEMTDMMKKHGKDPLMDYTHQLGEAMLKVTDILENMSMEDMSAAGMMAMHHMHIMINHAMEMAAQGSNLVMLGQMRMAGAVDKLTIDHGKEMLDEGRSMVADMMTSKEMMEMHEKGMSPQESPMMAMTHHLAEAATKVIDLLSNMPAVGSK